MYTEKRIFCVIPARGGSKRLSGKNIRPLLGKPLIAYAIEAALQSKYVDKVVVSTDDEAIAEVAKAHGAEVPFVRPAELSTDTARSIDVFQHAVRFYEEKGEVYDYLVLIQPTVPGVLAEDVDAAIKKIVDSRARSCISMCDIADPPEWMFVLEQGGNVRPFLDAPLQHDSHLHQELYRINGAVYVVPRNVLMEENCMIDTAHCVAVVMPKERSVDIDTEVDFKIAETCMTLTTKEGV